MTYKFTKSTRQMLQTYKHVTTTKNTPESHLTNQNTLKSETKTNQFTQ